MNCPKCRGNMEQVTVETTQVDRCQSCEGLWFDLREHEHLQAIRGSEKIDSGDPARGREHDSQRDIECPHCHVKMIKMSFAKQPHIHYEMCSVCSGIYLDAGEFTDFKKMSLTERIRYMLGRG